MVVNILGIVDDAKCYEVVRQLRWPDGVRCPHCDAAHVVKQGRDETQPVRRRYECRSCGRRFDDLTDTVFAGHHQPLRTWILVLYFMGLNLSNEQIAHELDLGPRRRPKDGHPASGGGRATQAGGRAQRRGRIRRGLRGGRA